MHHHVLESVPVTSDNVSGFKLNLTVLRGLYSENEATREHITVRRNLLAEDDLKVPRASRPAISERFGGSHLRRLGSRVLPIDNLREVHRAEVVMRIPVLAETFAQRFDERVSLHPREDNTA